MTSIPEENFYRVSHLVLDEIPTQLRDYFKSQWNTRNLSAPWDDTITSRQLFLQKEKNITDQTIRSNIRNGDRNKWDGTTLFAVLLYSSHNLLIADPNARVCIDDLRKLRNTCYGHLHAGKIEDPDYQQIVQDIKNAFSQMQWSLTGILATETKVLVTKDYERLRNDMQAEKANNKRLEVLLNLIEERVGKVEEKTGKVEGRMAKVEENIEKLITDDQLMRQSIGKKQKEIDERVDIVDERVDIVEKGVENLKTDQLLTKKTIGKRQEEIDEKVDIVDERVDIIQKDVEKLKTDQLLTKTIRRKILLNYVHL